jgi:hypothetical protein
MSDVKRCDWCGNVAKQLQGWWHLETLDPLPIMADAIERDFCQHSCVVAKLEEMMRARQLDPSFRPAKAAA